MRRIKPYAIAIAILVFTSWNLMTYYILIPSRQPNAVKETLVSEMQRRLDKLQADIQLQLENNDQLLKDLRQFRHKTLVQNATKKVPKIEMAVRNLPQSSSSPPLVIAVLVIACDRITVSRCLDQLLRYRPSKIQFPIIVSQDCGHQATAEVIRSYGDKVTHIKQPNLSNIALPWPQRKFQGYYKISRHYKWAIHQAFQVFNYSSIVIVEDDLNISPDFFEYFAGTHPLLVKDPSLWCVSAWNDNGKGALIQDKPEELYRTDFFPGLGWMLLKKTWLQLEPKWPDTFWDDWMRHPDQRRDRACIRPEICRTSTFGKVGVSKGQFYEKHLKFIQLNEKYVPFTQKDLSYLLKENYDPKFITRVYSSPKLSVSELKARGQGNGSETVRVEYSTKAEFVSCAKQLGVMEDMKAGVPRAGYRGVATFMYKNIRIFLAPPSTWTKYDPKWN